MSKEDSGNSLLAFLLGIVAGAIIGILFAPAEGKETRKKIAKYLEELEEKGEEFVEEGKRKIKEIVEEGKEKIVEKFHKEKHPAE